MRVVVTGQVGLDKTPFLRSVVELAALEGQAVKLFNVGQMMYAEAPDVAAGRILDLPLSRLHGLRRSVFKDVLGYCRSAGAARHIVVNTHATFRWRHGLFHAFDHDQMQEFDADLYVVLVDDVDRVHGRLVRDGHADHTLKDLMVWREEEILATELMAQIVRGHGCFYICSRGAAGAAGATLARLILHPQHRKAYLSYPMSHVGGQGGHLLAELDSFCRAMGRHFVCFDPGDLEEKPLAQLALKAAEQGRRTVTSGNDERQVLLATDQLLDILPDIDGQIYARDFKLIDQSDMIISMIPQFDGGRPGLSSGVERELQHAHEAAKDVFVIWRPEASPSPFVTETATRVFRSVEEALTYFDAAGYLPIPPRGTLFA